jgi:hypothetical protein
VTTLTPTPPSSPAQPAPPATGPAAPTAAAAPQPRGRGSTPQRMRTLALAVLVAGLVLGAVGAWSYAATDGALGRARDDAAQLVRLQDLQTQLLAADAAATSAFLVGGLEPAGLRQDYTDAVGQAGELLTSAAAAQGADEQVLAALDGELVAYTQDVEQARAANRQGFPIGSQYLRNASAGLRADGLPLLAAAIDANTQRTDAEFGVARSAWIALVAAGLLTLAGLVAASVWLARRTHRYLSVPLVAATVLTLVVVVASAVWLGRAAAAVGSVQRQAYAATTGLSTARAAGFDARSNEALTLIARGSGTAFEEAWGTSAGDVVQGLSLADDAGTPTDAGASAWQDYADTHADVREQDDSGQWDQAVATAVVSPDPAAATQRFAAFDAATQESLAGAQDELRSSLASAQRGLVLGLWIAAAAGLAVAALAWNGFARRIEDYR